jgi:UDP-glucose 4-epimerase
MKILIAGGAGYIGSVTTEMLCDEGHDVVVFDSLERGYQAAVDPRAKFLQGDLRYKEDIKSALLAERPEAVIHFAAYIEVGESMKEPMPFFENNVSGSLNLMSAMVESGCKKLIFSSTCATYGTPDRMPMDESLPQNPESVYGESKLLCEKYSSGGRRSTESSAFSCAISMPAAPRKNMVNRTNLKATLFRSRDGTCIRDYIHIKDLAQAHILALKPGIRGGYNLGNGDGYTVKEVIDVCREVTGHPIPAELEPRRAGDCAALVADAAKAKCELGWDPQFADLGSIVQSAWDWHQAHPDGYSA